MANWASLHAMKQPNISTLVVIGNGTCMIICKLHRVLLQDGLFQTVLPVLCASHELDCPSMSFCSRWWDRTLIYRTCYIQGMRVCAYHWEQDMSIRGAISAPAAPAYAASTCVTLSQLFRRLLQVLLCGHTSILFSFDFLLYRRQCLFLQSNGITC